MQNKLGFDSTYSRESTIIIELCPRTCRLLFYRALESDLSVYRDDNLSWMVC